MRSITQAVFAMDGVLFQFYILNDGKVLNVPLFMADNLDSVQLRDPDFDGGANQLSLRR